VLSDVTRPAKTSSEDEMSEVTRLADVSEAGIFSEVATVATMLSEDTRLAEKLSEAEICETRLADMSEAKILSEVVTAADTLSKTLDQPRCCLTKPRCLKLPYLPMHCQKTLD